MKEDLKQKIKIASTQLNLDSSSFIRMLVSQALINQENQMEAQSSD